MIGQWLDKVCTPVQEDRLLTTAMIPWRRVDQDAGGKFYGCLGGIAFGEVESYQQRRGGLAPEWFTGKYMAAFARFNALCMRLGGFQRKAYIHMYRELEWKTPFPPGTYSQRPMECSEPLADPRAVLGGAKAAELIRTRILKNRARRALAVVTPQAAAAVA